MSDNDEGKVQNTQHALLVAWGWFAEHIGLIQALQAVPLHQKQYTHKPQTKVLEFLVAILAGLEHLQDISRSAHPLDQDQAVAEAWGQSAWADYSGVSRTLSSLSWDEARALSQALEQVEQPLIQAEREILRSQKQRLCYDGDLTGLPVSNSSRTYPDAAFGHMGGEIRLGYQAAVVSMESPTYGRLWLWVEHHPGDTVSSTQAEALVLAAEARTGLRPRRRTELLRQRIEAFEHQIETTQRRLVSQEQEVQKARCRLAEAQQQLLERQAILAAEKERLRQREERPTGRLAQARKRLEAAERRCRSREKALQAAEQRLGKTQAQRAAQEEELKRLQERLARFEQENETNPSPIEAEFRLDAGFGTYDNIALLIEMGYEVYTKAHNHRLVTFLKDKAGTGASWERVGANAEMMAWSGLELRRCPYPLDVGLERFHTGDKLKYSGLLHFGDDPVGENLTAWFGHYNGWQTIEAGIKEGKGVFYLHRIKVRSELAIYLQERMVLFAANFIRWATAWLSRQAEPVAESLDVSRMGVKRQVRVGTQVSAQVVQDSRGKLLTFSEQSVFAGKMIRLRSSNHSHTDHTFKDYAFWGSSKISKHSVLSDNWHFLKVNLAILRPFSNELHLIAQPLG